MSEPSHEAQVLSAIAGLRERVDALSKELAAGDNSTRQFLSLWQANYDEQLRTTRDTVVGVEKSLQALWQRVDRLPTVAKVEENTQRLETIEKWQAEVLGELRGMSRMLKGTITLVGIIGLGGLANLISLIAGG